MHTRRRFHQLALAGLALPTATLAQDRRAIVLGQSVPLTGPAAQLGLQMQLGAKAYFEAVNAAGGVGGLPIVLRTLDDGYDPARCKANTETVSYTHLTLPTNREV